MDKATLTVSDNTNKHMYQRQGSNPMDPHYMYKQHNIQILSWCGVLCPIIEASVFLPKNVTMNHYNHPELLSDHPPQSTSKCNKNVFMQDGAPDTLLNTSHTGFIIVVSPILIPDLAVPQI